MSLQCLCRLRPTLIKFAIALAVLGCGAHRVYGAAVSPIAAAMPMDEGPRQLYLQAVINGNRISGPQPFTWRMGSLWASPEVLRRIGFKNPRSEEHTSELQSLMRISYAVFCLKKKKT